jgi:pimeloyl-ACP methyl ester carboxylesterase
MLLKPQTLFYKNTPISFTDTGVGEAIVLLHGFLENQLMWQEIATTLTQKYRVVTLDLLGHGATAALGYIHTMEENAAMLTFLLQELQLKKVVVLGHSMGGYVALAFAEANPKKVKALILLNSTPIEDSPERKKNRDRAVKAVKKDHAIFVRLSIGNLFGEANRIIFAKEIENIKLQALKTPVQGIVASLEGMKIRKDRTFILQENKFAKMLLLGNLDPVLDCETTAASVKDTNTSVHFFSGGHMSHIENKIALEQVLTQFLTTVFIGNQKNKVIFEDKSSMLKNNKAQIE